MSRPRAPLFLERESYRRRRLMDAARVLPVIGLVLFLLPALWRQNGDPNTGSEALYLFAVWAGLILAAGLLARPLRRTGAPRVPTGPEDEAPTDAAPPRDATPRDTPPTAPPPDPDRRP